MKVSKSFDVFGTYVGYFLQYYQSLTFVKAISFFFFFLEDVFVYPPKRSWSECLSNTRCLAKNNHYLSTITQSFKLKSSNYSGKGMEIKKNVRMNFYWRPPSNNQMNCSGLKNIIEYVCLEPRSRPLELMKKVSLTLILECSFY